MSKTGKQINLRASESTIEKREKLYELFRERPFTDDVLLTNLGLFMRSGCLAKIFFLNEIYEQILQVPGYVMEFGVWLGQSLAVFENLRAMHEPYNYNRKTVGFDTFEGYPEIGSEDKVSDVIALGNYAVKAGYPEYLRKLLAYHEGENVMSHLVKTDVVVGNADVTVSEYLDEHQECLIALAFFDMALYKPTKAVLEAILPRMPVGALIAFDELCSAEYPGETKAFLEILGVRKYSIKRSRFLPDRTYVILGAD